MDTETVEPSGIDNPPPKPFQFTASAEMASLPTAKSDASTNMASVQQLTTETLLETNAEKFSTPDNQQSGMPLIQPLSQSPHIPGKTPHATMTRSKLFTATTTPATVPTNLQSHEDNKEFDSLSQNNDFNSSAKANLIANKTTTESNSNTGQQDADLMVKHNLEQFSTDSKDVVTEKDVDANPTIVTTDEGDRDLVTATETSADKYDDNIKDDTVSGAANIQLGGTNNVKGMHVCTYLC